MIKARKFLLFMSILGLISLLLVWMSDSGFGNFYLLGLNILGWKGGPIVILSYLAICKISLMGERTKNIDLKYKIIATVISFIAVFVISIRMGDMAMRFAGILEWSNAGGFALIAFISVPTSFIVIWLYNIQKKL